MIAVMLVAAALWVAVVLARPRRPAGMDETPWLVYSRAVGGMERLVIAAVLVTAFAFFVGVIAIRNAADRDLARLREPCLEQQGGHYSCWRIQPGGRWEQEHT